MPTADQHRATWSRSHHVAVIALLVAAVTLAYAQTFSVPFVFDDIDAIQTNPTIREWSRAFSPLTRFGDTAEGRPVYNASLAVSYSLSGLEVWGHHLVNLGIHQVNVVLVYLLVGGVLTAVAAREAGRDGAAPESSDAARVRWLYGAAIAGLWGLHPLCTQAVTYLSQRAESLAAMWALLTLFGVLQAVRANDPPTSPVSRTESDERRRGGATLAWSAVAVLACWAGMGTKEVCVSLPLFAIGLHRVYLATNWHDVRRYWWLYLGLMSSWLWIAALLWETKGRSGTVSVGQSITPMDYLLAQGYAILRYLQLTFWPVGQVFDYGVELPATGSVAVMCSAVVASMLIVTMIGLWKRPRVAFPAAVAWLWLAPSSSVIPVVTQTMSEHRMYLPLLAVVIIAAWAMPASVVGRSTTLAGRLSCERGLLLAIAVLCVVLGAVTFARNTVYLTTAGLWADVTAKWPQNARARWITETNYVLTLPTADQSPYLAQLMVPAGKPERVAFLAGRAGAFARVGEIERALADLNEAVELDPTASRLFSQRGQLRERAGDVALAIDDYSRAIELDPGYSQAISHRAIAIARTGDVERGIQELSRAITISPHFAEAWYNRGILRAQSGQPKAAAEDLQRALWLTADDLRAGEVLARKAMLSLSIVLQQLGRGGEAAAELRRQLRLNPAIELHIELAQLAADQGRSDDALAELISGCALSLQPPHNEQPEQTRLSPWLGRLERLVRGRRYADARRVLVEAERHFSSASVLVLWDARLLMLAGEKQRARTVLNRYLQLVPDDPNARALLNQLPEQ